jgi:RNA polymerase sigma-70 factor (ECF subfamily)
VQDAAVSLEPGVDRLRAVYDEVHPRLWRAVLAWSGSHDVADEACAEAFAQFASRGDAVRDPAAWVWRTAFRIAAGELARRRRDTTLSLATHELEAPLAALPTDALDLLAALRALSDQQRACVVLAYVADLPAADVAAALGTSTAVVRVQLMRARRRLRELLTEETDHD